MIVFDKLWETMKLKDISQYKLIHTYKVSESQLTRLRRNQVVKTEILDKLCMILTCRIEDICEFKAEDKGC
jgi:putative transcriptional regulator